MAVETYEALHIQQHGTAWVELMAESNGIVIVASTTNVT